MLELQAGTQLAYGLLKVVVVAILIRQSPRIHANPLKIREDWRGLVDSILILRKPYEGFSH
jgi:hypothetical protein